jgi:surface polysaccharide O-acyltransferase-like enzyme
MQKERESNFELLRIISMFLVLVVHADYFSLGAPSLQDCVSNPVQSIFRIGVESISIICVNVFVLISGWFGIRFKWKSICNFLFQVFFFGVLMILMLIYFQLN